MKYEAEDGAHSAKCNSKTHKTKAPGLETDALLFYLIFTYEAIFREIRHKLLPTKNGAVNLRTRNTNIGKKMIVHCTEFADSAAAGYELLYFLTNVHLLSPHFDDC
ncbi:hypothetical protein AVM02_08475 [Brucella anthropi]